MLVDSLSNLEAVMCIGNISDVESQRHHVNGFLSLRYLLLFCCTNYLSFYIVLMQQPNTDAFGSHFGIDWHLQVRVPTGCLWWFIFL